MAHLFLSARFSNFKVSCLAQTEAPSVVVSIPQQFFEKVRFSGFRQTYNKEILLKLAKFTVISDQTESNFIIVFRFINIYHRISMARF